MSLFSAIIISTGIWRAVLITPGGELPFQMEVQENKGSYSFTIINGKEHMLLDEVSVKDDSLIVRFPVYESELRLKVSGKEHLEGSFINLTRVTNNAIRMEAFHTSEPRFAVSSKMDPVNVAGKWAVTFADSSIAVGVFEQNKNHVEGTFLTTSGDYRFLEGTVAGDSLFLSTFNGVFVYLFKAKITGDKMEGMYYSGTQFQTSWQGTRNEKAQLPDASSLTTYNNDKNEIHIRFPDPDSVLVSLDDSAYKGKIVILQILGSWCPNCLDETAYLAPYYDKNKNRGMEIIGLAFEKTNDFSRASENVKRLRKRLNINYKILIAANRDKVKATLPGIDNFMGFPTTLILDKTHKVRKIYAGFSGAATGVEYEKYKSEFEAFMNELIEE